MSEASQLIQTARPHPPGGFTRGTGTIFQYVGVIIFVVGIAGWLSSGNLSERFSGQDLRQVGWGRGAEGAAVYSIQRGLSVVLVGTFLYGAALAAMGTLLKSTHGRAPILACVLIALAIVFYLVHGVLFTFAIHWVFVAIGSAFLGLLSSVLLLLAVMAAKDRSGTIGE